MLDTTTKRRIDSCRDMLVGRVPDPKSQVELITIALIYKFMDDMDAEAEELGGHRSFFAGDYAKYGWAKLLAPSVGGQEMLNLFGEAIARMPENPGVPALFRSIFKNAYLPFRDPETLRSFLKEINGFTYDHSERLGDAFEYLLSVLGSQGDAGQFRTPRHIIDFIVSVVDPQKNETVLDPACGTAGFLISSYKHILAANTQTRPGDRLTSDERAGLARNFTGYDISPDMVRLSLVNLYLHGFREPHIEEYDTLTNEDKWIEHADVILANPPFMSPKGGIRPHKRFSVQSNRSEVLFVDYIAEHLTPNGRAGVIVPEGIIFQAGGAYKALRKMLVEKHLVAVVSLPAGVFQPYSGVKTSLLVMDRALAKASDSLLFVKVASDGFGLGAQRRAVDLNDLPDAARLLTAWRESLRDGTAFEAGGAANVQVVAKSKIAASGDYNLSGDRYGDAKAAGGNTFPLVSLDDVCERVVDTINPADYSGEVNYIGLENIEADKGLLVGNIAAHYEDIKSAKTRFCPGHILYGKLRPNLNKVYYATQTGICSTDIYVLKAKAGADARFIAEMLRSPVFNTEVLKGLGGAQLPRVSFDYLSTLEIPLPPLAVQQEIVAEIAGYQKVIDGARQVVENYTPRIDVRPEWSMVELGSVSELNPKKSQISGRKEDTDVSFVPMADLSETEMLFDPKETRSLGEVVKQYTYFEEGDILLAKVTPCFENGKSGVARGLRNGIGFGSSEFHVLRADAAEVLPEWLYLHIANASFINAGKLRMTGTGGLQRVPKDFVSEWQIPLPDLETQRAIVAEIEAEQRLVHGNKELAARFEAKIQAAIGRVWGDGG